MNKKVILWVAATVLSVIAIYTSFMPKGDKTLDTRSKDIPNNSILEENINNTPLFKSAQQAPNFTLLDLTGKKVSLSDYLGKNIYLNFFATWCPPCVSEMGNMQKVYDTYKDKNFTVLAVDLGESKDTVQKFINKNNYTFPVLLDRDQKTGEAYETYSIPVSIFIDKEGKIVSKVVGAMSEVDMKKNIEALLNN